MRNASYFTESSFSLATGRESEVTFVDLLTLNPLVVSGTAAHTREYSQVIQPGSATEGSTFKGGNR